MLTHKGTQTIETERLMLRKATVEDVQPMFDNWANDENVTRFLTWPPHQSTDVTKKVIESWIEGYKSDDYYQWMIVPKAIGQPIGSIGVVSGDAKAEKAEIGYCIGAAWWHCGFMSEALKAVMDFLFDEVGMNRVEAKHDINNPHSGGVMRKCGMHFEGISRGSVWNNQGICDTACYALLKSQRGGAHFMDGFEGKTDEDIVQEVYRRSDESSRLTKSQAARVEFITNVKYIEQYLSRGDRILDIGAGAGEYSIYFAEKGYEVAALELADSNVAAFRTKLNSEYRIQLLQGNALCLDMYEDDSFDIVLLFGPLYHLHSDADKRKCIEEAKRVCKPNGKIFFTFISNDIVVLTMQQAHPDYLLRGAYDKDSFKLEDFPFVFHSLEQCRSLLDTSGIRILKEVASDGVSELLSGLVNDMDAESYKQYLRYHFYICEKKECLGFSNHLLFVGEAKKQ